MEKKSSGCSPLLGDGRVQLRFKCSFMQKQESAPGSLNGYLQLEVVLLSALAAHPGVLGSHADYGGSPGSLEPREPMKDTQGL